MLDFASPNAVKKRAVLYACISVQLAACYRTSETVSTCPSVQQSSTTQRLPDRTHHSQQSSTTHRLPDGSHHSQQTYIHSPGVSQNFNPSKRATPHLLPRPVDHMDGHTCITLILLTAYLPNISPHTS
jgi:hypothetical protein